MNKPIESNGCCDATRTGNGSISTWFKYLALVCSVLGFGFAQAKIEAVVDIDEFGGGASTWNPLGSGWSAIESSPGRFDYRGDFKGDTLSRKTNILLEGSNAEHFRPAGERQFNDRETHLRR